MNPVVGTREPTGVGNGRRALKAGIARIQNQVLVVAIHANAVQFKMTIFESQIATDTVKRLVKSAGPRKEQPVEIKLVFAVVIKRAESYGSVVARTRRTRGLNRIPAFGIPLEIKFLRHSHVNVFCAARRIAVVVAISQSNGPREISVVRIAS